MPLIPVLTTRKPSSPASQSKFVGGRLRPSASQAVLDSSKLRRVSLNEPYEPGVVAVLRAIRRHGVRHSVDHDVCNGVAFCVVGCLLRAVRARDQPQRMAIKAEGGLGVEGDGCRKTIERVVLVTAL